MFTRLNAVSLAALATAATSLAAPLLTPRDDQNGCISLGKGPLGFNASAIGIYNYYQPQYHLTFRDTPQNRYGDDYLLANPAHAYDDPEFFELISCKTTPPQYPGKGSTEVYQGYIKTADGQCVQRTSVDSTEGQFSKKPCAYSLTDLTGNSAAQHFQFSLYSFYSYYSVVFLGSEEGPTSKANTSFTSGGQYKLSSNLLPDSSTQRFIEADFEQGVEQPGNLNTTMIAQLGDQYQPDKTFFPDCTLVKSGSLEYTDGSGSHPVSLSSVSLSYYDHGLIPVLNGTESSDSFEFYQCNSYYMGYGEQSSTDTVQYGHLQTTEDTYYSDCFHRNRDTSEGASTDLIISNNDYDGCGKADNSAQLRTFYSYDSSTGEIRFLGAPASANKAPLSWTLDGNNVTLSTTPTSNMLRFTS